MATCTLTLYNTKIMNPDKNQVIDYIETYLLQFTGTNVKTITDFQWQRNELYKTIKINLSQDNSLKYSSSIRYDYAKIDTKNASNVHSISYYFILAIRQKAEGTIELDLKMDVLNTYQYIQSGTPSNNQYTLSDRSLITREHKDRFSLAASQWEYYEVTNQMKAQMNELMVWGSFINTDDATMSIVIDPVGLNNLLDYLGVSSYRMVCEISGVGNPFLQYRDRQYTGFRFMDMEPNKVSFYTSSNELVVSIDIDPENYENVLFVFPTNSGMTYMPYGDPYDPMYVAQTLQLYAGMRLVSGKAIRKIDYFPEGIEAITFKQRETGEGNYLLDDDGMNTWYVQYSNANNVVSDDNTSTEAIYVNPVKIGFYTDVSYTINTSTDSWVSIDSQYDELPDLDNLCEILLIDLAVLSNTQKVRINGITFTNAGYVKDGITYDVLTITRKNNDSAFFENVDVIDSNTANGITIMTNVPEIEFYGINSVKCYGSFFTHFNAITAGYSKEVYIGSSEETTSYTADSINEINLSEPKLIKIINFPYSPRSDLAGLSKTPLDSIPSGLSWNATFNCLEVQSGQQAQFSRTIRFSNFNPFSILITDIEDDFGTISDRKTRNKFFESKLYHSDYYFPKFVYDSFGFAFRLENMDETLYYRSWIKDQGNNKVGFRTTYTCSPNITSKFSFKFPQYVCKRELQDFNNVLVCERNNEMALYTSAYINYIKSGGFRHDTKSANTQKMTNGLLIGLSTIGAIASFASTPLTGAKGVAAGVGLLIGTASKTISAIHSAQEADRAISQKLLAASQQSESVSTNEDLHILKSYCYNKAKLVYYKASDYLIEALWDLFHYFGYKCMEYKVPNVNTRCNFNFVQGDILLKQYTFGDDIANEIINKWKEGVTFFHKDANNTYDLNQEYENLENIFFQIGG